MFTSSLSVPQRVLSLVSCPAKHSFFVNEYFVYVCGGVCVWGAIEKSLKVGMKSLISLAQRDPSLSHYAIHIRTGLKMLAEFFPTYNLAISSSCGLLQGSQCLCFVSL